MSTTRMMILGVVRLLQPVHGYDVRRELLSWHADRWANVQPGSVYHALKKLADEGALREVGSEQVGARPARTRYEVTDKGHEQLRDLLTTYLWGQQGGEDPFLAAFSLMIQLPRAEVAAALRDRARRLRADSDGKRAALDSGWAVPDNKPTHVRWMLELDIARAEGEIAWCERVAGEIEAGTPYVSPELAARWQGGFDFATE
ncbi:PadR family transcriptional regulator [Catellatospora sp. KI3]|uniref:PadR family transcriptional regulator n=1 Tax=Catellatospora sp. KI3 TaxID=3041620 RepID=UPI00248266FD|nr:PadR family transcriptional regulator [Catellatospora sp. KI3]MDI1459928.1 PadR family transcriptional regulator [Catellatospora sp. KI3]